MGSELFRRLALSLTEAEEKAHFGNADFRVRNRIFAGFNDKGVAYVKLTLDQQEMASAAEPGLVFPVPNGWAKQGWTNIDQAKADERLMKSMLTMAWKNVAPKTLVKAFK